MKIDTTILREAMRRLMRGGSKGSPSQYGYCAHCGQNEAYRHSQVIEVMGAIADHAESVRYSERYAGIYVAESLTDQPANA